MFGPETCPEVVPEKVATGEARLAGPECGRDVGMKGCKWCLHHKECKTHWKKCLQRFSNICKEFFQMNNRDTIHF